MERPRVKLCGTTSFASARLAAEFGADYLGVLVAVPFSERNRTSDLAAAIVQAVPIPVILLTWNTEPEQVLQLLEKTGAAGVQLLGDEPPEQVDWIKARTDREVWKSLFLPPRQEHLSPDRVEALRDAASAYVQAGADKLVLDVAAVVNGFRRHGGTGQTSDWSVAAALVEQIPRPTFLAGGIRPENVVEACRTVRPYGVDLCSGVERRRGVRDRERTAALFRAIQALKDD